MTEFPTHDQTFFLSGPAGALEVAVSVPDNAREDAIAIVCHPHPLYGGTMDNKVVTTVARTFKKIHIPAVRFNFRGIGESDGTYDNAVGEVDDAEAVLTWVKKMFQPQRPNKKLFLLGFSFGSLVAARLAAKTPIDYLVSIAPPLSHTTFPETLANPDSPWLVIQPEQDEVIDPQAVYQWAEQQSDRIHFERIAESSHFFHGKLVVLQDCLLRYIEAELNTSE